ncbi:hypothetical protein GGI15_003206 [Coemansia interrupta]|uniref:Tyrosyl-DNA phosphodiesterase n=1 Tax=Coemansia interrupta TaxID=1126814 RepID=A0A9W8LJG3_9FUNG|nr:hypothetical protein GGI15_003206 [Coemansia interrupta]
MSRNLDNYRSDDDATKEELRQFDTMINEGVICISDSDDSDGENVGGIDTGATSGTVSIGSSLHTPPPAVKPKPQLLRQAESEPAKRSPEAKMQQQPRFLTQPNDYIPSQLTPAESMLTDIESVSSQPDSAELPFPEGVVRLTQVLGTPVSSNSISLAAILQKDTLRKALMTTFVLDLDWLVSHVSQSTKLVVVTHYDKSKGNSGILQSDSGRIMIVHMDYGMQRWPVMHSKLMLLFYDNYVRFVASSANLFAIDWTVLENIVFIQDFPYIQEGQKLAAKCDFGVDLVNALKDLSVPEQVIKQLDRVDFSAAKVHIVTSVPTTQDSRRRHAKSYGLIRLKEVANKMRCALDSIDMAPWFNASLYCYGSSMGKISLDYLRDFYLCALGTTQPSYKLIKDSGELSAADIANNVFVGFHTQDQGNNNKYGDVPRNSIKFKLDMYFDESYPSQRLYKITPEEPNVLVHAKVFLSRFGKAGERGWIYLGSHNFTPGAWGTIKCVDRPATKYINNYEFGVILPNVKFESMFGRDTVTWNGSKVPLPFKLRWEQYGQADIPCMHQDY